MLQKKKKNTRTLSRSEVFLSRSERIFEFNVLNLSDDVKKESNVHLLVCH